MKTILNLLLLFIVPIICATIIILVTSFCLYIFTNIPFTEITSYPLTIMGWIILAFIFFFALIDKEYI